MIPRLNGSPEHKPSEYCLASSCCVQYLYASRYVPELEQRDWAVISDSNSLCYGIRVICDKDSAASELKDDKADPRGIPVGIERARFPGKWTTL